MQDQTCQYREQTSGCRGREALGRMVEGIGFQGCEGKSYSPGNILGGVVIVTHGDSGHAGGDNGITYTLVKSLCCMPDTSNTGCQLHSKNRNQRNWGAWAAQPVERLFLDFGSNHDLRVREIKP